MKTDSSRYVDHWRYESHPQKYALKVDVRICQLPGYVVEELEVPHINLPLQVTT